VSSSTQICNIALSKIGQDSILSLDENTRSGRICNLIYNDERKVVLRAHNWNFATKRVELAQLTSIPDYEYSYYYQLPSDFVKIIGHSYEEYSDFKYKIEGDKLLTNEGSISIKYIYDVVAVELFYSLFKQALSAKIAAEASVFLTDDEVLYDRMMLSYNDKISQAKNVDSQEGTPDNFITSTWINSRL
jgi:hypothetical protein